MGLNFKVRPEDQKAFAEGEVEVIQRWWHPAKGDVVFDVGCGTGLYSMPAMAAGAFVYAFDAVLKTLEGFMANAKLNNFTLLNYSIFYTAVGSKNKRLYRLIDGWEKMGISKSFTQPIIGDELIAMRTLDSYSHRITKLDWLKIDVEGFELDVLNGAMGILKKYHPKMIIENHSFVDHIGPWMRANGIWPNILLFLRTVGYEKKMEEQDYDGRSHLYCE